jgi:hypothetical protein
MPAHAAPTSPCTLLLNQLYNGSSKSDSPSVSFPCVQQQQLVLMPAPTGPTSPRTLSKQLDYGSSKSDVPSVTFPCVQQQQLVMMPLFFPSGSTMEAEDVICFLCLLHLQGREHQQGVKQITYI